MRSVLPVVLLIVCLTAVVTLTGCLFGKKGEETEGGEAETTAPTPKPGPKAAAPPAAPSVKPLAAGPEAGPPKPSAPKPGGDPEKAKSLVSQAKQAKAAGDYDKAKALLEQALTADANNADAHWILAWICAEQGNKQKAISEFDAFLSAAGGDPRASEAKKALDRLGAEGSGSGGPGGKPPVVPSGSPKPPGPTPGG